MKYIKNIALCGIISAGFIAQSASASILIQADIRGNDCAGVFETGNGFSTCQIFGPIDPNDPDYDVNDNPTLLSPVIAKFGGNLAATPTDINTAFPSIDGSEWQFSNQIDDGLDTNIAGDWTYTPGANDPLIRFWSAKAGNSFTLFWEVDDDSQCTNPFALECLQLANAVNSGSWETPGDKSLSHIVFYDGAGPVPPFNEAPEPGVLFLFGSGILGMAAIRRRKQ